MATNGKKEVEKVLYAQCKRCPAGKEPFATCKHIVAFFNAVEQFSRLGYTRENVSYPEKLQTGNHRRKQKAEVQPAVDIDWSRLKLTGQHERKRHPVSDQRHQQDRGSVSGRVKQIVHGSCVAGRLRGLTLLSGNRAAIDLVNKGLRKKRLCRTKALSKQWLEICKKKQPVQG